ncbi:DUF4136 domain-containing protein [Segetibacter koreensis]|uniref:DUF4136 domain-containing protein n=1 Tax=Segetibacter koreensis TaxID=398037 RepID=UPI000376317B|nr:DUF4136 domain-containing protein [Segetibacter koreensis]
MRINILWYAFMLLLLPACSPTMRVFSDYDKDANISNYKTYSWPTEEEIEKKGTNPLYYNELNDKRIKNAVYEQMKSRGFTYQNEKQPLEMHYHIIVEDKTFIATEPGGYVYPEFWQLKRTQAYPYQQGTLIIDLMDTRTKMLVWRGWATGAIEDQVSRKPEQTIQKAVAKIFKLFPYQH